MLMNVLQAEAHPDRHSQADASQQQAIADKASEITDAYAILKQPHLRATHLLELHGLPLNEETGGEVVGMDFLMDIMEVREELEEANNDPETLRTLRERAPPRQMHLRGSEQQPSRRTRRRRRSGDSRLSLIHI